MFYVLTYDYVENIVERRAPHREAHLAQIAAARERGEVAMAGAFDPPTGALIVFETDDASLVERFAAADPYVANGLVTAHRIQRWNA